MKLAVIVMSAIFLYNTASAAEEEGILLGVMPGAGYSNIADETPLEVNVDLYRVFMYHHLSTDIRLTYTLAYSTFKYTAENTGDIGQRLERYSITAAIGKKFRVHKYVKPVLSVGLAYHTNQYYERYMVDEFNFIDTRLADKNNNSVAFNLMAMSELWGEQYKLGWFALIDVDQDKTRVFSLGIYFGG